MKEEEGDRMVPTDLIAMDFTDETDGNEDVLKLIGVNIVAILPCLVSTMNMLLIPCLHRLLMADGMLFAVFDIWYSTGPDAGHNPNK